MQKISRIRILLFILPLVFAGCMNDHGQAPVNTDPYPAPVTPDILMENFTRAYGDRDLDAYIPLLHEDYAFSLQACTLEKLGLAKDHFDLEDEIIIARNMFSGRIVKNSRGQNQPAITDIEFLHWEQVGAWRAAMREDVADCREGTFNLILRFRRECAPDMVTQGQAIVYVAGVEEPAGVRFRILGWVDLTQGCFQ